MKRTEIERSIIRRIGEFYLIKQPLDDDERFTKANKEIDSLEIVNVKLTDENTVNISLGRPGLIIGLAGSNIDELTKYLQANFKDIENLEIKIIEDDITSLLHVVDYGYYDKNYDDYRYHDEYDD